MKTNIVFNLCLAFSFIASILLFSVSANGQNSCGNFAGDPGSPLFLCAGVQANGYSDKSVNISGSELRYYLHTGSITNFIAQNQNGIFSNNTGSYPFDMQLYISAAVGPIVNGVVDFNDPCTDIHISGTPVVFLSPITIDHKFTCNTDSVNVDYKITGGYPGVLSSNYTVQGSIAGNVNAGIDYSFSLPSLNGTYILFVEDFNGCKASISQDYECGTIDLSLIKRLANGQSNIVSPGGNVTFTFEITNQGNVPVSQVSLVDYIPSGLTLSDPNWVQIGQTAGVILNPPTGVTQFLPGGMYAFNITFGVSPTVTTPTITNSAEIAFVRLVNNGEDISSDEDSVFDINPDNNGIPINDTINDPSDQDSHDIETIIIETCGGIVGTMPIDTIFNCYDQLATAIEDGSTPAANDVSLYILHTSATSNVGTIEDSNTTGTFSNPDLDCTILYISYVFGPNSGDGTPDLDDACTIVLQGTPVVWSPPIIINASESCNMNQSYNVRYDITGGFATCENSMYTVNGDVNLVMALPGENYLNSNSFDNNSNYTVTVEDSRGCLAELTKGPIVCEDENPCDNNPGTMPGSTLYGCAGSSLSAIETNSQLGGNDVGIYILHDSSTDVLGNVTTSDVNGEFDDPQSPCSVLYISYVFGPDDGTGEPDLNSDCTHVLPGTPVIWASPVSITSTVNCDEANETFTFDYTVTGGFAECNSSNYMMSGDVNITTATVGTQNSNTTEFNHLDSYTIIAEDEQGCTFVYNSNMVVCENENVCENEAGLMSTAQLEACANTEVGITQIGSTLGPNDIGIYYLHDSPTGLGNIIANSTNGTFIDPDMYCTTLYISYVFGPDVDGNNLPDTNNSCTKILNGTPVIWVPEVTLSSTVECVAGVDQYLITYTVNGGMPSCNANSTYELTGTIMESNVNAGTNTHSVAVLGGMDYQITLTDNIGCFATDSNNGPIDCLNNLPFCGNTQGVMQAADNPNACSESTITATQTGAYLISGYIGGYYLHTNANTTLGTVIDSNTTGTFTNPGMPCTTLYISYVFGPDDGNGNILLDDDCSFVLQGIPVVWAQPLSLVAVENCDEATGNYTINLNIGGGFAVCDNSLTYNVTGDIILSGVSAGEYTSGALNGGSNYTITLEDGNNCVSTYTSEPISCEIVCSNFEGTPNAAQILCENDMTDGKINDVTVSSSSTLVYVLHNGANVIDTIYAVNNNGTFINDGTYPVNSQLYISAVIGNILNNDSIPDLTNACTVATLPGTPVVFLTDVSITTDIVCNESTGEATIDYVANGGHPAYDNSLSYTISGDDSAIAAFGDTITFTNNTGSFTLTATDDLDCNSTVSDFTNCSINPVCVNQTGTQPSDAFLICEDDEVIASSEGALEGSGATLVYVLHDGDTALGNIIDTNGSGIFSNSGSYPTGVQLYISAMVGVLSPAGVPDINDECTIGNFPGTPVTFLDDSAVECMESCTNNAGDIEQEALYLCFETSSDFSAVNTTIQDGYTLLYALHDGQNIVGTIADFSNDGTIINDGSYAYNTPYYVSPLITSISNGNPDLNDPCLSITLPGQQLWFLSPITIDDTVECRDNGQYDLTFSIMGGAPALDGLTDNYNFSVTDAIGGGGGMISLGQNTTPQPLENPDYTVEIVDSNECEATFFRNDVVCDAVCPDFSKSRVPNIFSPNNDASNRLWSIPNLQECYPNNRVIISNRWGSIVWDKENCEDNCWDGTAQNSEKELPTGAYYYVIQLNGENSAEAEILSGTITLLR